MDNIIIRPAVAQSAGDAQAFSEFAEMAAGGLFTQMLGGKARSILAKMFGQTANDYSFEYTRFITVDDQIAGMISGYINKQKKTNQQRTHWLFLRYGTWRIVRLWAVAFMSRQVFDFMDQIEEDAYYIQMVGLYSQFRGRGLSKVLLTDAENTARQMGCASLALDVDIHNNIAIAAYQSYGFHIAASSPLVKSGKDEFAVHRMMKTL
jgi:ribosomal protein S18 acetylase RimI-like enzyme